MIVYQDMTFCSCKECINLDCNRNINHINWDALPDNMGVAMSDFSVCCLNYRKGNENADDCSSDE